MLESNMLVCRRRRSFIVLVIPYDTLRGLHGSTGVYRVLDESTGTCTRCGALSPQTVSRPHCREQ